LVHRNGVVAAEGDVEEVANVLPWLEGAIKKHFPQANYEHAATMPGSPRRTIGAARREMEAEVDRTTELHH
jgi:hypothetical protein